MSNSAIQIKDGHVRVYMTGKHENKFAKVSFEDLDGLLEVSSKWHLSTNGYAATNYKSGSRWTTARMHRVVCGINGFEYDPNSNQVDHINGDKLDNRSYNLRVCSNSVNKHNCGIQKNNTSETKGVFKMKDGRKRPWCAQISFDKKKHTRYFKTEQEAIDYRKSLEV